MNNATRYALVMVCSAIVIASPGCSTVRPEPIKDQGASWDGNERNSGFIGFNADGSATITPHARERYNALIESYGGAFTPPLARDAGLGVEGKIAGAPTWRIDAEHLVKFATMNRWRKEGRPEARP